MSSFSEFISLEDPTVKLVLVGVLMISISSALIGNYAFLRKRAMIGDAVAHSVFPGVCLSFIVNGEKNPLMILAYSIITGLIAMFLIDVVSKHKRVKTESAIGIVLSLFFGLGIVMLSYIQGNMGSQQSGLGHFFFGQAASLSEQDIDVISIVSLVIIVGVVIFYRGFKTVSFDRSYASARGYKVVLLESLISILTVMAIAIGINAVGIVLMAALLLTPASSARLWTSSLSMMMLLGVMFSVISTVMGTYMSYAVDKSPTGPWIVVFLSVIALGSILIAPKKGVIPRWLSNAKNKKHG